MEEVKIEQINYQLTWQIRHEVMYPDYPLDKIKLDNEEEGLHFGLFTGERLTSVISLFWEKEVYQFRKFATLNNAQGKGYGSFLLQHVINVAGERGATRLWCNARLSAAPFYERFELVKVGQGYIKDNIDYVTMELIYSLPSYCSFHK
ncbi:GNAT family N-acetyltransferase [Pedobacter hartonius]|nr:GNAT family N-acetyltransferase [Pedobacter hartonius]